MHQIVIKSESFVLCAGIVDETLWWNPLKKVNEKKGKGIKFKLHVTQVRAFTFLCLHIGSSGFYSFTRQYYSYISSSRNDDDDDDYDNDDADEMFSRTCWPTKGF